MNEWRFARAYVKSMRLYYAFVTGIDLNSLIGVEFEVQGVRFAGTEQCKPCHWMDSALGHGAENWLQGRGGLRARILTDGALQCGG